MKTTVIPIGMALLFGWWIVEFTALGQSSVPQVGDKAPDFVILKAGEEKEGAPALKVSDLIGKKNVLVAFFPKAFTPGCTTQLCGYRDDFARFQSADTDIVAVSVDPQAEGDRFKSEKAFPFHVVGDPDAKIVKEYGVPLVDLPAGHVAKRSVFLIDKAGVIRYIDPAYDVTAGKDPLYDALKKVHDEKPAAK
jgi:peroxiredoxin Q/BCP